jgi:DNA repair protein RadC
MKYIPEHRFQVVREKTFKTESKKISGSDDAKNLFQQWFDERGFDKEVFVVATLNTKNVVTAIQIVTMGTLDASLVHPREVFRLAIHNNASSVIVAHNHPSGDPTPSREDIAVTNRIKEAGKILGIDLLDHIVVGSHSYSIESGS